MFVHQVHSFYDPDQYLSIEFSDLLDLDQNLEGLIELDNVEATTRIEGNRIYVYPSKNLDGDFKLKVRAGSKPYLAPSLKSPMRKHSLLDQMNPK